MGAFNLSSNPLSTLFPNLSNPLSTLFPNLSPQQDPNYGNAFQIDLGNLKSTTSPMPDYAKQFAEETQPILNQMKFKVGLMTSGSSNPAIAFKGKQMADEVVSDMNRKADQFSQLYPVKDDQEESFSDRFNNSTFGKNYGLWSAGLNAANSLFTDIAGPKSEYAGEKGDITQTMDGAYDTIQNLVGNFGPIGKAASLVIGANKLLGNVANKLGGGTDGQTTIDAVLGSSFLQLTPFGLINGFGGETTDTITRNNQAFETVGSSYTGTDATVNDALTKSGKKYGLFSRKAMNTANDEILEARRQQNIMTSIANNSANRFAIRNSMAAINGNRRKYYLQGGYNQADVRVGKSGMSLDLIAKAKKVLHESRKLKGGGQITPTEILLVVPEFQDGGQINKKSRTLQELIEYAKKENPRFIQRMSEPPRGIDFVDDDGKQARGSHYMEWSTDDNGNAIIYPRIQEVDKELKFFNSSDAYNRAMENKNYLIMTPEEAKLFFAEDPKYGTAYKSGWPQFFGKFQQGGSINIIPEGALHAHKHNMDMEGITPKGIPVVSNKEGGEVEQQAEIEREEIIFRLEVTKKLEELEEKYYDEETSQREKDECALEAGKLLVEEILYNTQDNTNKLL